MSFTCRRYVLSLAAMLGFAVGGCSRGDNVAVQERYAMPKPGVGGMAVSLQNDSMAPPPAPMAQRGESTTKRFIAESDRLEVVASESALPKAWEAAIAFCQTLQCEVVSSGLTSQSDGTPPSGEVSLCIAPADFPKLLGRVGELARVVHQTTTREDKTAAVVDTEAKIRNLTAFRDNLRAMMSRPGAKVSDLLEIQEKLSDTQAELDSEASQRKTLANETEKIAVDINFRVDSPIAGQGAFAPLWDAFRQVGRSLAVSTGVLVTVAVAILPWLFALALLISLASLALRRWRRRAQ